MNKTEMICETCKKACDAVDHMGDCIVCAHGLSDCQIPGGLVGRRGHSMKQIADIFFPSEKDLAYEIEVTDNGLRFIIFEQKKEKRKDA